MRIDADTIFALLPAEALIFTIIPRHTMDDNRLVTALLGRTILRHEINITPLHTVVSTVSPLPTDAVFILKKFLALIQAVYNYAVARGPLQSKRSVWLNGSTWAMYLSMTTNHGMLHGVPYKN